MFAIGFVIGFLAFPLACSIVVGVMIYFAMKDGIDFELGEENP